MKKKRAALFVIAGVLGICTGLLLGVRRTKPTVAVAGGPAPAASAQGTTAATTSSPPSFQTSGGAALQTVPGAPGYDPIRLTTVVRPRVIFAQEPRDEAWAPEMERYLRETLARDLAVVFPGMKASFECKTTACKMTWDPPRKESVLEVTMFLYPFAGGGTGEKPNELVMIFAGGWMKDVGRDAASIQAALDGLRTKQLAFVRKTPTQFPDIDPATWERL